MPARADNPDGFWENLRFVALNDELLNEFGGAWDLPPKNGEDFKGTRLDPIRKRARSLTKEFGAEKAWGWKDPRNSLTHPFWKDLLPELKALIVVRNPLEVSYSMHERNGTSYSFGLRLWEIYNRRVLESTRVEERLITHYNAFFENPEKELERIAQFAGLSSSRIREAASLVTLGRRHTEFTTEQLLEARISPKLLELYRKLSLEAGRPDETKAISVNGFRNSESKSTDDEILPGATNRLDVSVPDKEPIRRELAELRGAKLHLERELIKLAKVAKEREDRINELSAHSAKLDKEMAAVRERFTQINELLRQKSISLAESTARGEELVGRLRRQLHATRRLLRLLDDFEDATARLRASRRWKIANPFAALKAKFSRTQVAGYGHLEKIVADYSQWRLSHPETAEIDEAIQQLASPEKWISENKNVASPEPREPARPIEFAHHQRVETSIIIPVFNQIAFTQACLASIQEHRGDELFEVIVVDDCSTDETRETIF